MRKGLALAIAAALVLLLGAATGNALAADKIIMRVATGTAPDHPENVGANKFKEILEKKSNGRVEVHVHPAGQLGSQRDFVEALRSGTLEITMVTLGFYSAYDPLLNIFELPYLFRDRRPRLSRRRRANRRPDQRPGQQEGGPCDGVLGGGAALHNQQRAPHQ